MAQLVARSVRDAEVVGSNPITQTIKTMLDFDEKHRNFIRASKRKSNAIIKDIDNLDSLLNQNYYRFSIEESEAIFSEIKIRLLISEVRFYARNRREQKASSHQLVDKNVRNDVEKILRTKLSKDIRLIDI